MDNPEEGQAYFRHELVLNVIVFTKLLGFGAFADVLDNPSAKIVEKLTEIIGNNARDVEKGKVPIRYIFRTLSVSVDNCNEFHSQVPFDEDVENVFIHIGVDARGSKIKLEQCAYNNMSFRVPDDLGYQPMHTPISSILPPHALTSTTSGVNSTTPVPAPSDNSDTRCLRGDADVYDAALYTSLPLGPICHKVNDTTAFAYSTTTTTTTNSAVHSSIKGSEVPPPRQTMEVDTIGGTVCEKDASSAYLMVLSTDPGRYLCNYVYFKSLLLLAQHNRERKAVFVHVPPFEVIPIDTQVALIAELVRQVVLSA
jgi:pyrrolidone-carboxylate peptidase